MTAARAGWILLLAITVTAALAPLLAGARPIVIVTSSGVRLPAVSAMLHPLPDGRPPVPAGPASEILWSLGPPVPHDPLAVDLGQRLRPPGQGHWLGTDELGRDILARLIHASRPSLFVAAIATLISILIGVPLGAAAGYDAGRADMLLSRAIEASLSFPALILLLLLAALAMDGRGVPGADVSLRSLLVVGASVGVARWGVIARYMRGEVLRLRGTDLALASRATGATALRTISCHLVPAGFTPVAVSAAFGAGSAVIAEASLSFLGMGIQPPTPTWGQMIAASGTMGTRYWWMLIFPGAMVALTVASFNLVAEGLRRRASR